jgi:hypothetical protein
VHWSFDFQEKYIRRFYYPENPGDRETKASRAAAGNPKEKRQRSVDRKKSPPAGV